MRHLKWDTEPKPAARGRNAYAQAALINAAIAVVVVVIAIATGGSVVRAVVAVLVAWAAGTAYSWWRIRGRGRAGGGDA